MLRRFLTVPPVVAFVLTLLMAAPAWAQAELAVEKTGSPGTVVEGGEVTYTVVVRNTGDATADEVELRDILPAEARFISAETSDPNDNCTPPTSAEPDVVCDLGAIEEGESETVTIRARIRQTGTNRACAQSPSTVPPDTEVCDRARTRVVPDLQIDKIDDRDPVTVGGNILYTLRIDNEGAGTVGQGEAIVIDELPIGEVRLVSVDSNAFDCDPLDPPTGRIRCNNSVSLGPGDIASIKITVDPDETGTISNTATVGASGVRIDTDTETTRVLSGGGGGNGGGGNGGGGNGGGTGGGTGGTGGGGTGSTGTGTTDGGGLIVDTTGDGVLIASADDEQYKDKVIAATIPDKVLPNTGGMPLLGLAALALASVVAGASVLRAGTRRRG